MPTALMLRVLQHGMPPFGFLPELYIADTWCRGKRISAEIPETQVPQHDAPQCRAEVLEAWCGG